MEPSSLYHWQKQMIRMVFQSTLCTMANKVKIFEQIEISKTFNEFFGSADKTYSEKIPGTRPSVEYFWKCKKTKGGTSNPEWYAIIIRMYSWIHSLSGRDNLLVDIPCVKKFKQLDDGGSS